MKQLLKLTLFTVAITSASTLFAQTNGGTVQTIDPSKGGVTGTTGSTGSNGTSNGGTTNTASTNTGTNNGTSTTAPKSGPSSGPKKTGTANKMAIGDQGTTEDTRKTKTGTTNTQITPK